MFFKLKVHAAAGKPGIVKKSPDAFEIWVRAKAERGLANEEALRLLARELGVEAKRLRLIKGAKTPGKIARLLGT